MAIPPMRCSIKVRALDLLVGRLWNRFVEASTRVLLVVLVCERSVRVETALPAVATVRLVHVGVGLVVGLLVGRGNARRLLLDGGCVPIGH